MRRPPARPYDLLVYYGWLNSFNSATNLWNNERVAQQMARYGIAFFGDGIQDPGHGDYANTEVIIPRLKTLNPNMLLFGYVTANQSLANFETKAGQWNTLAVDGIIIDEAGYDFGVTRSDQNSRIDYVHGLGTSNTVFINAWDSRHILGTENDPSYPNSTYNPSAIESTLTDTDWFLVESFSVNTTSYSGSGGYATGSDWKIRGDRAASLRQTYGLRMGSAGTINNDNGNGQSLFNFCYYSALAYAFDANGSSDTNYGASSAAVTYWTRPGHNMALEGQDPSVQQNSLDNDQYFRYGRRSKITMDFSTSAQTASFERW